MEKGVDGIAIQKKLNDLFPPIYSHAWLHTSAWYVDYCLLNWHKRPVCLLAAGSFLYGHH